MKVEAKNGGGKVKEKMDGMDERRFGSGKVVGRVKVGGEGVRGESDKESWWELLLEDEGKGWKEIRRKKKEEEKSREERRRRWLEEREEEGKKMGRGRSREEARRGEEKEGEKRNLERVEGEDEEQRLWLVEEIVRRTLGRETGIRGVVERRGEGGRWILIMEMEKVRDKEEILETGVER